MEAKAPLKAKFATVYASDRHLWRLIFMIAIWMIFIAITRFQKFYSVLNFQTMASQFPEFGLMALGVMICMITGGIDLSVVGVANLTSILMAYLLLSLTTATGGLPGYAIFLVFCLAVVIGAVAGAFNGILVSKFHIPPILATMGSGELSISLWTTATSSSYAYHMLFNYQHASAGKWAISWYNGKPHAFCGNTTGTLISANQYHNTGWVHVVITIKGTTNGAKLYVNTNLEDTKNVPSKTTGTTVAPSILALEDGTLGADNNINDIVIWNRELTASEISQVFNATAPYYEES